MNRFRPAVEPLECRLNPAGTVTGSFANGTWTLIGDAEANDFVINAGPEHNSFFVTGLNGTTVAGVTKIGRVKNIVIKLGEGNDHVRFNDVVGETLQLRGNLTVVGGNGANELDIERMDIGKNLAVRNGEGFDRLILGNSRVRGNVNVNNGQGDSELDISRSSVDEVSRIRGKLVIRNGSGSDYIQITDTNIGGNVNINNGLADNNQDAGAVQIFNLTNTFTPSIIGGNLSVTYAGGEVNYEGIWDTEVLGDVAYNYGAAEGEFHVNAFHVLQPVRIHGNLTITGQGATFVDIGVEGTQTGLVVDGDLAIRTGAGADLVQTYLLHVGGKTLINTGDGTDQVMIDDSTFARPVQIRTGAGADTVLIETRSPTQFVSQFAAALNVSLGDGDDLLSIGLPNDETARIHLLKGGFWSGGAGDDRLEWRNPDLYSFPAIDLFEAIAD